MIAVEPFGPSHDTVLALLQAGIQAPSADNRHHVRFRLHTDGFSIHADDSFIDSDTSHRRLLTLISFGAIVENIRLKLTEHGHSFVPRWFPASNDPGLIVRIRWSELEWTQAADPLVQYIEDRHTNRHLFRGPQLSRAELAQIEAAVRQVPGVELNWYDEGERRRALLQLIRIAETGRFANQFLHRELFESIDFDVGWKSSTQERLAPGSLGVEAPLKEVFKLMRHWSVMRIANGIGAHRILGFRAGDIPARLSPHCCSMSSSLPFVEGALATGVAFQRLWLTAESLHLALQPMVASAILAGESEGANGLPSDSRATLKRSWKTLLGDTKPLVVFRLGRARRPTVRSGRKPIESYLDRP